MSEEQWKKEQRDLEDALATVELLKEMLGENNPASDNLSKQQS